MDSVRTIGGGGVSPPENYFRYRRIDGSEGIVEVHSIRMEQDGRPLVLSAMLDVTQRVEAERARESAEARYRALVELAPEGIVVSIDGRFVFVNAQFAAMVGASSPDELVGRLATDVVAPHERDRVKRNANAVMWGRENALRDRLDMIGLDGREFTVDVSAITRIEFDGQPAAQAMVREIPAYPAGDPCSRAEALDVILASADALLRSADGPLNADQQRRVEEIAKAADCLRTLYEEAESR